MAFETYRQSVSERLANPPEAKVLLEQIRRIEADLDSKHKEIGELQQLMDNMRSYNGELETKQRELQQLISTHELTITELRVEVEKYRKVAAGADDVRDKLSRSTEALEKSKRQAQQLQAQVSQLQGQLRIATEDCARTKSDMNSRGEEMVFLRNTNRELSEKSQKSELQLAVLTKQLEMTVQPPTNKELVKEMEAANSRATDLEGQLVAETGAKDDLSRRLQEAQRELQSMRSGMQRDQRGQRPAAFGMDDDYGYGGMGGRGASAEKLRARLVAAQDRLSQLQLEYRQLQTQLAEAKEQNAQLQNDAKEAAETQRTAEETLRDEQAKLRAAQDRMQNAPEQKLVLNLMKTQQGMASRIEGFNAQFKVFNEERAALKEQLKEQRKQVRALQKEMDQKDRLKIKTVISMSGQMDGMRQQIGELQAEIRMYKRSPPVSYGRSTRRGQATRPQANAAGRRSTFSTSGFMPSEGF